MAALAVKKEVKVKGFLPSTNGFDFPNRFPGIPLPGPLEKLIDTSNSVHGLCGGMCFSVIDYAKSKKKRPLVGDVPKENTKLYKYLADRQGASWGTLGTRVLRYVEWMTYSDQKAAWETWESWEDVKKKLEDNDFAVLGLIYTNFRESVRVWDNHQVLAYGYSEMADGTTRVHLYDPNYPKRDDMYLDMKQVQVKNKEGKTVKGLDVAQFKGDKKIHEVHGFLVVPYEAQTPPDDLD